MWYNGTVHQVVYSTYSLHMVNWDSTPNEPSLSVENNVTNLLEERRELVMDIVWRMMKTFIINIFKSVVVDIMMLKVFYDLEKVYGRGQGEG